MAMYRLDYTKLERLAKAREVYSGGQPFPHVVVDNFLPAQVVGDVLESFPRPDAKYWHRKHEPTSKKLDSRRLDKEAALPDAMRGLVWELNSYRFLAVLESLTGISGLLPDPYLEGAGPHMIEAGGYLKVHADFNLHPYTGLHRRLNLLVYLNADWEEAWGGHLELWERDLSRCARRVSPILNRAVIFNTDSDSWHGHPEPLRTPPGVQRRSLAMYYYTVPRVEIRPHNTIYRETATD